MKKFNSILLALLCLNAFAQNSVIKLKSDIGQGYMVLDKTNHQNVDHWDITITKRTYNADATFVDEVLEKETLPSNRNYKKLSPEYRRKENGVNHLVTIEGFTASNIKITEETQKISSGFGPPIENLCSGCTVYGAGCKWTCNGDTYAWDIQQYVNPSNPDYGPSMLAVETAYDYFDEDLQIAIPYYMYSAANPYNIPTEQGVNRIVFYYDPFTDDATYVTQTGNILQEGWIVGEAKDAGPWKTENGQVTTDATLTYGLTVCSNDRWWAIGQVNTYGDFTRSSNLADFPTLTCTPQPGVPDFSGSDIGGSTACLPPSIDFIVGVDGDFYDYMDAITECYNSEGFDGGFGSDIGGITPWWKMLDRITIVDLNDGTGASEPISINMAKFFNSNKVGSNNIEHGNQNPGDGHGKGEWEGPVFSLPPSLYSLGLFFKNGKYIPHVLETETLVESKYELEKLLDVTIYPTPLTGNKFDILMKANATLNFDYELRDSNGNLLHTQKINAIKDQQVTRSIHKNNIPSGILLHQFVFEDGSVQTVQTIKN